VQITAVIEETISLATPDTVVLGGAGVGDGPLATIAGNACDARVSTVVATKRVLMTTLDVAA